MAKAMWTFKFSFKLFYCEPFFFSALAFGNCLLKKLFEDNRRKCYLILLFIGYVRKLGEMSLLFLSEVPEQFF